MSGLGLEYKNKGNKCFNNSEWEMALEFYNKGLELNADDVNLLSNRASIYLKIGYFNATLEDCERVLKINQGHHKAIYRKAIALENLCFYENGSFINKIDEAVEEYKKLLNLVEDDENIKNDINLRIKNCFQKLDNSKGIFNRQNLLNEEDKLNQQINSQDYKPERLDSESNTFPFRNQKVKLTDTKLNGVSVIACENIYEGELLLVEKALVHILTEEYEKFKHTYQFDLTSSQNYDQDSEVYQILATKLSKQLYNKQENVYLKNILPSLYTEANVNKSLAERNKMNTTDETNIFEIIEKNAILTIRNADNNYKEICYGLWPMASFLNHSCNPNAFYYGIGRYLILKAIADIPKGNEIRISYIERMPYDERNYTLQKWGFKCDCPLCIEEVALLDEKGYKYINSKIDKIKYFMFRNNISNYTQLRSLKNDKFLNYIEKVDKINFVNDGFIKFLFYKSLSLVFSYLDNSSNKAIKIYLFEKCYEIISKISKRETYDILTNYINNCGDDLSNEKSEQLNKEIKLLNKILFDF
jgi:hypothetical protein